MFAISAVTFKWKDLPCFNGQSRLRQRQPLALHGNTQDHLAAVFRTDAGVVPEVVIGRSGLLMALFQCGCSPCDAAHGCMRNTSPAFPYSAWADTNPDVSLDHHVRVLDVRRDRPPYQDHLTVLDLGAEPRLLVVLIAVLEVVPHRHSIL